MSEGGRAEETEGEKPKVRQQQHIITSVKPQTTNRIRASYNLHFVLFHCFYFHFILILCFRREIKQGQPLIYEEKNIKKL